MYNTVTVRVIQLHCITPYNFINSGSCHAVDFQCVNVCKFWKETDGLAQYHMAMVGHTQLTKLHSHTLMLNEVPL